MAISSEDFVSLWQRYKVEAVPAGISVNHFFLNPMEFLISLYFRSYV